ncbi:hypothetical protein JCM1840_001633 [Sporobolomyces johnsonii]
MIEVTECKDGPSGNSMKGMRWKPMLFEFSHLVRSYGNGSCQTYRVLQGSPLPSDRRLRSKAAEHQAESFSTPTLSKENVAAFLKQLKRFNYDGPIVPLPGIQLFITGVITVKSNETGEDIQVYIDKVHRLARAAGPLISLNSDVAAPELAGKRLSIENCSFKQVKLIKYRHPCLPFALAIPVFEEAGTVTPLLSIPAVEHIFKALRNQLDWISYSKIKLLLHLEGTPLRIRDVYNVDKQDNAAVRCLFSIEMLSAMVKNGEVPANLKVPFIIVYLCRIPL